MGHKVHPIGIRLGIARDWNSKWYATKKDFANYLIADIKTRDMLRAKLVQAGISRIQIERPAKTARRSKPHHSRLNTANNGSSHDTHADCFVQTQPSEIGHRRYW